MRTMPSGIEASRGQGLVGPTRSRPVVTRVGPLDATMRCGESMQRFHRLRSRLSIAAGTIVATIAMATVICMTAHLLD